MFPLANQKQIKQILILMVLTVAAVGGSVASASDSKTSASLSLNQDAFFGQWNQAMVGMKASDKLTYNAYGIIWSNPFLVSGQAGAAGGTNNWTEFGLGATFTLQEGLSATALVGVTSGSLLSGGKRVTMDGYVPNLTVNYNVGKVEAQLYSGFYLAAQDNGTTNDYLHFWLYGGYKLHDFYTVGLSHEQLDNSRSEGGEARTVYRWFGPYVNFAVPNANAGVRFAFGTDSAEGRSGTGFYKLSFNLGF